jgi:hypothetical protein
VADASFAEHFVHGISTRRFPSTMTSALAVVSICLAVMMSVAGIAFVSEMLSPSFDDDVEVVKK